MFRALAVVTASITMVLAAAIVALPERQSPSAFLLAVGLELFAIALILRGITLDRHMSSPKPRHRR